MGQEGLLEDLRKELAAKKVLVVVGTGVSIQASGGDPRASWDGLISNGIEWASRHDLLADHEAEALHKKLKTSRLKVADQLTRVIRDDLPRWLRDSVGDLPLDPEATIIEAVHAIGAPLATTNYDDLLSRGRAFEPVPWTEVKAALELLRGDRRGVLHFHGYYDAPDSVVLGVRSYHKVLASRNAQAIQQAVAAMHTLLFIGCGDGLDDPNFGALLRWSAKLFAGSIYTHYSLCRKGEARPKAPHVKFIEYGEKYDDLPSFIHRELAPDRPLERVTTLPATGFCVGRESEVNELVTALLYAGKVPVLGGPGMGKTTIALAALHDERVAARFGTRRYFVRLDGAKTRGEVVAAIAIALGMSIALDVERAVFDAFAKVPAALVLDNAETPLDGDQKEVEGLFADLSAIEPLSMVVTIRGMERPHSVPWAKTVKAKELVGEEAVEAFVGWSGQPAFKNDPDLPKLLAALDGVPLAITLMAHYAELFDSLDIVWQRWSEKRTAMLKDRTPGTGRLHDIAVSYELSIGVLSDPARRLLSVLALLPDGAAQKDLSGIFANPDDAADELRRRALVVDEERRVRMRAPLREYLAAARPPEAPDEERAIGYYLSLAAQEGKKLGTSGGAEAIARLAPEVANVEAVLGRRPELYLKVIRPAVYGWGEFMRFTGVGSTTPIEAVMTAAGVADNSEIIAQSAETLAVIALSRSDHEGARKRYEEALPLYQRIGDVLGEATCIQRFGDIALERSDYEGARKRYEEALPLYQRIDEVIGEAICVQRLGDIALSRSDHEGARKWYEEALPLYQRVGGVLGEANCIKGLGDIALSRSDHEGARKRYEEALPLYQRVGDVLGEANCIKGLGDIALSRSDHEGARTWYEEALPLYQRVGRVLGEAHCVLRLGDIAFERSDHEGARKLYEEALPLYQRVGGVLGEADCVIRLGDIMRAAGETTQALSHYRTALALYGRVADPYSIGCAHERIASLTEGEEREANIAAARAACTSIGRDDLIAELDEEFGSA